MEKIVIENCFEMMYNKCLNCKYAEECRFKEENIKTLETALQKIKAEKNNIFQECLNTIF